MRRLLFTACILLLLGQGGELWAEPAPKVRLSYVRDASAEVCPDEESMRREVSARLGRQPFSSDAERLLTIRLRATAPGFRVDISVQDAEGAIVGKRTLNTRRADCAELANAMQLAIAIAIDPLHTMPSPPADEPARVSAPRVVPPPVVQVEASPPAPPALPPSERLQRHQIGVGLSLAASSEPNPTVGITLHYRNRGESLSWGLEGRADKPTESAAKSGQIETSLWAASGLLCVHPGSLDACAVASAGVLRGQGMGYREARSFSSPYAAAGLRLAHSFPVQDSFAIDVGADVLARLNTTTLLIDEDEEWTSSPLEIALGARAVWTLR